MRRGGRPSQCLVFLHSPFFYEGALLASPTLVHKQHTMADATWSARGACALVQRRGCACWLSAAHTAVFPPQVPPSVSCRRRNLIAAPVVCVPSCCKCARASPELPRATLVLCCGSGLEPAPGLDVHLLQLHWGCKDRVPPCSCSSAPPHGGRRDGCMDGWTDLLLTVRAYGMLLRWSKASSWRTRVIKQRANHRCSARTAARARSATCRQAQQGRLPSSASLGPRTHAGSLQGTSSSAVHVGPWHSTQGAFIALTSSRGSSASTLLCAAMRATTTPEVWQRVVGQHRQRPLYVMTVRSAPPPTTKLPVPIAYRAV